MVSSEQRKALFEDKSKTFTFSYPYLSMGRPLKMKRRAEKYERTGSENPTVGITASWKPPK
jgi:hypothetical protein